MSSTLSKVLFVIRKYFKSSIFFKSRIIADSLVNILRVIILTQLYAFAYSLKPEMNNLLPFESTVIAFSIYFAILIFGYRNIAKSLGESIRTGEASLYINKPMNYLFFKSASNAGSNLLGVMMTFVAVLFFFLFIQPIEIAKYISLFSFLIWIVIFAQGVMLGCLIYTAIGLCAIWFEQIEPVYWIVDKSIMLLGGAYIPVAFMPKVLVVFAEYSPFGAISFATQLGYPNFLDHSLILFLSQLFWIIFFLIIVRSMYKKLLTNIFVNGG